MDHPFRSAAVGGFNKQDVLSFLEEQSKQSAQAQQLLRDQLEEANRQLEVLGQERDSLSETLDATRRQLEATCQARDAQDLRLKQLEQDLSDSRTGAEQTARALERARQERDEAKAALEALRPDAQAFVQLKERTAGVELEAHRRAQTIQEKADYDAQKLRRQMEQWIQRMGREYEALRAQVEEAVAQAISELNRAEENLEKAGSLVAGQGDVLEGIKRTYHETDLSRVEAPMPIEEE